MHLLLLLEELLLPLELVLMSLKLCKVGSGLLSLSSLILLHPLKDINQSRVRSPLTKRVRSHFFLTGCLLYSTECWTLRVRSALTGCVRS